MINCYDFDYVQYRNYSFKIYDISLNELCRYRKFFYKNAIAIAYVFIENLYRHMVTKIVQLDKSSVMINFNDLIEFHAIRKKENSVEIRLRPGMGAKLIIKSDESTESDDDDGLDE